MFLLQGLSFLGNFWQPAAAGEGWLLEAFASTSSDSQILSAVPGRAHTFSFQLVAVTDFFIFFFFNLQGVLETLLKAL